MLAQTRYSIPIQIYPARNQAKTLLLKRKKLSSHSLEGLAVWEQEVAVEQMKGSVCNRSGWTQPMIHKLHPLPLNLEFPQQFQILLRHFKGVSNRGTNSHDNNRNKPIRTAIHQSRNSLLSFKGQRLECGRNWRDVELSSTDSNDGYV